MKKINELTIYTILCQNVTLFYQQELASSFQVQEKLKGMQVYKFLLALQLKIESLIA